MCVTASACVVPAVLLVVSSTEPDVMETFAGLYTKQKESEQTRSSNWLTPHMLYYHILLHDVLDGGNTRYWYYTYTCTCM